VILCFVLIIYKYLFLLFYCHCGPYYHCGSIASFNVCLVQAFTTDFRVHWAQHPLRPEFVESTYFIYKVSLLLGTFTLMALPFP